MNDRERGLMGTAGSRTRIASLDLVRGAVMILMAIDHVRVYSGVPPGGPDPAIFFTRWITHFCAPAFVFLAGTGAFFHGRRHADLSRFLLTRGAWLIVLEATFVRLAWTFNFDFGGYALAGVIWVIGVSMILLAGLARLPVTVVGAIGVAIVAGHNLLDAQLNAIITSGGEVSALAKFLYVGFFAGPIRVGAGGPDLFVLYSIIPWVGVMAAGYAFGRVLILEPGRRDRICLWLGCGAIALFLLLRGFDLYGDPVPWRAALAGGDRAAPMPAALAFLNTSKYPASLAFLLMTLGPILALLPLLDRAGGTAARWVTVFGRVPFFYYVLHLPLIHALAIGVSWLREGTVNPWLFANHPMGNPPPPAGYAWSLPTLYLVWAMSVVILYFACRWFAGIKARRSDWWLGYL
jgi:uncharacterized membrane protein